MKKQSNVIKKILTAVFALVFVGCAAFLIWQWIDGKNAQHRQEELKEEAVITTEPEEEEEQIPNPIDFATLEEEGPDIYAWIRIPDTRIDYPVVQTQDTADLYDEYYLRRLTDGTSAVAGSIFTQKINARDFSDRNTVLYGHNMRNGSMFADLHKYEDQTFMESHDLIYIYTPEHVYVYRIFAAVPFAADHVMVRYGFDSAEDTQAYLDDVLAAGGVYCRPEEAGSEDCLLTLSTCISQQANKRYLVVARLETAQ